jgi:polysaccharide pyruvyl transferase CsaB
VVSIVISGYYGFGNTGDEAILKATLEGLRNRLGDDVGFTVITGRPDEVERMHDVPAVGRLDLPAIYRAMRGADLFLSGGGGLLQDATSFRNLAYHLLLFYIARRAGTSSMIFAQSVGPIRTRLGRVLTPRLLRGLSAVTVRDQASAERLASLGLADPPAEVTADPSFTIRACPEERTDDIMRSEGLDACSEPLAVLAPRGSWYREAEAEALAFVADWLVCRLGARPLLLPMQYPDDLRSCDMILARMKCAGHAAVLRRPLAPEEVLAVVGRCEVVVGVRLHALIFAAAMKVPLVGVEYDPKVRFFLESLGLAPVARLTDLPGAREDLILGLEKVWAARNQARRHLEGSVPKLRSLAERNFDIAAAVARRAAKARTRRSAGETTEGGVKSGI